MLSGKVIALLVLVALLLAGGAVAAGVLLTGDDDIDSGGPATAIAPPDDASVEDFCDAYTGQLDELSGIDPGSTPAEQAESLVKALQTYAETLEEVGTPEAIPADAREGFEITLRELGDLDVDDVQQAIEDQSGEFVELSKDDEEKVAAFDQYATNECDVVDR